MSVSRQSKLSHIAALLAVSNMGLWSYMDEDQITGRSHRWYDDPENEVMSVAGFLYESDEHEAIFAEEAESWYEQIKDLTDDQIREKFSYHSDKWVHRILEVS